MSFRCFYGLFYLDNKNNLFTFKTIIITCRICHQTLEDCWATVGQRHLIATEEQKISLGDISNSVVLENILMLVDWLFFYFWYKLAFMQLLGRVWWPNESNYIYPRYGVFFSKLLGLQEEYFWTKFPVILFSVVQHIFMEVLSLFFWLSSSLFCCT